MRSENLFDAITQVREEYIDEAQRMREKPAPWKRWGGLAACLCAVLGALLLFLPQRESNAPVDDSLPKLTVSGDTEGMGFEGYTVYDAAELVSGNPWTADMQLDTLTVYKNLAYTGRAGEPRYLTQEQMLDLAEKTAQRLGETVEAEETTAGFEAGMITENYKILCDAAGTLTLRPRAAQELGQDDALSLSKQLAEKYGAALTEQPLLPQAQVSYNFLGEARWELFAYADSGNPVQKILNYNFRRLTFTVEKGTLLAVTLQNRFLSMETLGEYPIISADTARELLLNGNCVTTVSKTELREDVIRQEDIASVELVYRTGNTEAVFMPYYRFLVRLRDSNDAAAELGLTTYGAFYVPAVESAYLTELPVWDGKFN